MQIALIHPHYDEQYLETIKAEMQKRGAPTIRAIWSEVYGMWMAVEGCHRLRAAEALGIIPVIKDISGQKYATIQWDGESKKVKVASFARDLQDDLYKTDYITFDDEEA